LEKEAVSVVYPARATVPFWCGLLLLFGSAVQYLAWLFDIEWLRRPLEAFTAIVPWTIVDFVGTSMVLVLLALAVRNDSARYQAAAKTLSVTIGLVACVFMLEYAFSAPLSTFDTLLFNQMVFKAGNSFPGRPDLETCATLFMLTVAALVFDRKDRGRIEAFQVVVALAMFLPILAIHGYVLYAIVFQSLAGTPTTEMAVPTLLLFCVAGTGYFSFFPKEGLVNLFQGHDLAGTTIRRMMPTVILVPLALGWVLFWLTMRMASATFVFALRPSPGGVASASQFADRVPHPAA
jgi:hypothetical protein